MSGNLLYNNATRQVQSLRADLDRLEAFSAAAAAAASPPDLSLSSSSSSSSLSSSSYSSPSSASAPLASQPAVSAVINQITTALPVLRKLADDLHDMAKREITTIKREKALSRASQIREDYQQIQGAFDRWRAQDQAKAAARERDELMGMSRRNTRGSSSQMSEEGATRPLGDKDTVLMMDGLLHEQEVLTNSGTMLEDYINIGRNALNELYEQRTILKNTQRRLLDVATTLGLSTTVIRYIEQRTQQDKWILWGGIAVTLFLFWLILRTFG